MYQSPLHIFDSPALSIDFAADMNDLKRLRQKLMAEFALTGQTQIELGGKTFRRDDIIKSIDILMVTPDLDLHIFIYSQKNLLRFLEDEMETLSPALISNIEAPPQLTEKLDFVLFESFSEKMARALSACDFGRAELLFNYAPNLNDQRRDLFYDVIGKKLLYYIEYVQVTAESRRHEVPEALAFLATEDFARFLNILPNDFEYDVYDLVSTVVNMVVGYSRIEGCDRHFVYEVSLILTRIWCDQKLMDLIRNNHRYFSTFKAIEPPVISSSENNDERGKEEDVEGVVPQLSSQSKGKSQNVIIVVFIFLVITGWLVTFSYERPSADVNNEKGNDIVYPRSETHLPEQAARFFEFYQYRKRVLDFGSDAPVNKEDIYEITPDDTMNGHSPMRHIFKIQDYVPSDSIEIEVIVVNHTGRHLIVFAFDSFTVRSFFFKDGSADTLRFQKGQKLCLYFGNKLMESHEVSDNTDFSERVMNEVYFADIKNDALNILKKDYTLILAQNKQDKKAKLARLEFTKLFFEKDEIPTIDFLLHPVPSENQQAQ